LKAGTLKLSLLRITWAQLDNRHFLIFSARMSWAQIELGLWKYLDKNDLNTSTWGLGLWKSLPSTRVMTSLTRKRLSDPLPVFARPCGFLCLADCRVDGIKLNFVWRKEVLWCSYLSNIMSQGKDYHLFLNSQGQDWHLMDIARSVCPNVDLPAQTGAQNRMQAPQQHMNRVHQVGYLHNNICRSIYWVPRNK
jgi:hypothetical protein